MLSTNAFTSSKPSTTSMNVISTTSNTKCSLCGKVAHADKVLADQCRLMTAILGTGWGIRVSGTVSGKKRVDWDDQEEEVDFLRKALDCENKDYVFDQRSLKNLKEVIERDLEVNENINNEDKEDDTNEQISEYAEDESESNEEFFTPINSDNELDVIQVNQDVEGKRKPWWITKLLFKIK